MQEELDSVLRKIKNRKAVGLDEIPPEVWKIRQVNDILLRHCNAIYKLFVAASHQTGLDTRSKAQKLIKVGIKGRERLGTSRDSNPAGLCCSLNH